MRWNLESCIVRPFVAEDARSLATHGNNREVWRHLRDRFPHPYLEADAATFIASVRAAEPLTVFALEVDGEAAGSVGFTLHGDVERCSAEVGYWLGEAFWGRGIVSEVLRAVTPWALDAYSLTRVFAVPYADNAPSLKVLVKAGYICEGTMKRSAIKDGEVKDQALYAFVRDAIDDPAGFLSGEGP